MTTKYRDISGIKVRNSSSDLPANANFRGEVFYNSAEGKLKFIKESFTPSGVIANSTWSSKTNYPSTAEFLGWGFGTKDSVFVGGYTSPWSAGFTWDGSAWANLPNLATDTSERMGAGTSSAAFAAGGDPAPSTTAATEEYSGTVTLKTITDS